VEQRQSQIAERERFPGRQESVSLRRLRSAVTWENGVEHSGSPQFADTEGVTGSNPVAPTSTNGSLDSPTVAACQRFAREPLSVVDPTHYGSGGFAAIRSI
jgi:hypothetical protein